jgi:GTP cyclohydrolase III
MRDWNKERKCLNCGAVFSWRDRYDKQYCNAKCRKQAERKRKAESAQELYNSSMSLISKFSKLPPDERQNAIDCLNQLRGQIDYELRELKDPNEIQRQEMLAEYRRQRDL